MKCPLRAQVFGWLVLFFSISAMGAVQVATPVLSPGSGTYMGIVTVGITSSTAGATIYYTTNGSIPTTSSNRYTGPFTVSASETVMAIATASGHTQSGVAAATYTIATPAATPTLSAGSGT